MAQDGRRYPDLPCLDEPLHRPLLYLIVFNPAAVACLMLSELMSLTRPCAYLAASARPWVSVPAQCSKPFRTVLQHNSMKRRSHKCLRSVKCSDSSRMVTTGSASPLSGKGCCWTFGIPEVRCQTLSASGPRGSLQRRLRKLQSLLSINKHFRSRTERLVTYVTVQLVIMTADLRT